MDISSKKEREKDIYQLSNITMANAIGIHVSSAGE
jgi:hypothetical protein